MNALSTSQKDLPTLIEVQRFWERNGLGAATIAGYSRWVSRFCGVNDVRTTSLMDCLTARKVQGFAKQYARQHGIDVTIACLAAHSALRAWSEALSALAVNVPSWREIGHSPARIEPILAAFLQYRSSQLGINSARERRDLADVKRWLRFLASRHKRMLKVQIKDADDYLASLRRHFALATVCNRMSCVRQFLRFLHVSGRLQFNLAEAVETPQRRRSELPRALSWTEVRKILRQVDRKTPLGRRDYAVLLLMSLYGLGAAEVIALTLDDLDWAGRVFTIVRPKTGTMVRLPFLPAAAQAVAAYLRHGRPVNARTRAVFIRRGLPYVAFTSAVIRYMVSKYARRAGVRSRILGAHVLRHSFTSRQIDQQAPARVLSDILGHRKPESTSVYTRIAVARLRGLPLPVPR